MNNFKNGLIALALGATVFGTSCTKEEAVPASVVEENEVPNGTYRTDLIYNVHVIPSSELGKAAGLSGASVTLSQGSTYKETLTTTENGMAIFEGLREGKATLWITAEGYAGWNQEVDIKNQSSIDVTKSIDTEQVIESSDGVLVPLPIRTGTALEGFVVYNHDLEGKTEMIPANGFTVKFTLDNNAIQPNVFTATTDAEGKFSFTNVPNAQGDISIEVANKVRNAQIIWNGSASNVTPTIGVTKQASTGLITLNPSTTEVPMFDGEFYIRPWANFDFVKDSGSEDFQERSLAANRFADITLTAVFDSLPDGVETEYTGTYNATTGEFSFTNMPTDKKFKLEYRTQKEISLIRKNNSNQIPVAIRDANTNGGKIGGFGTGTKSIATGGASIWYYDTNSNDDDNNDDNVKAGEIYTQKVVFSELSTNEFTIDKVKRVLDAGFVEATYPSLNPDAR